MDGAQRGTARCEVMEGCWRVPPKIVRAHIAACGRGRVSKTRASQWSGSYFGRRRNARIVGFRFFRQNLTCWGSTWRARFGGSVDPSFFFFFFFFFFDVHRAPRHYSYTCYKPQSREKNSQSFARARSRVGGRDRTVNLDFLQNLATIFDKLLQQRAGTDLLQRAPGVTRTTASIYRSDVVPGWSAKAKWHSAQASIHLIYV